MKIKAKLILVIAALSVQFACNDWMALIPPEGLIREEYWKTKEEVQAVIMGAYTSFAQMDNLLFIYGEIRADLVKADNNTGSDEKKLMESNIYPDNYLCNWNSFYKVINYCNEVIEFAPQVKEIDNTFSDYQLKGYLSEAYFLRSLAYFYMVRIFKDVPLVLVPTTTDDAKLYLPKTDGDEILNHMILDLEQSISWATIDGYTFVYEVKSRATKASIYALLADIYLWKASGSSDPSDYESCIQNVNSILALNKYKLQDPDDWFQNYYPITDPVSSENIFEFFFEDAMNQKNHLFGMTQVFSYNFDPSQKALELFAIEFTEAPARPEPKRGEKRSIAKIGEDDYIIWKYVGQKGDGLTERSGIEVNSCNWIVYRLADVLLMKAEALSQLNRYTEARIILKEINDRAKSPGLNDLANSPNSFEDAIMDERAREFAFEGKRWFDLLRMGRRNDYSRKLNLIEIIVLNVPSTQKRILRVKLANPLGWYMPISTSEMERNKALVQNPYYNF